MGSRLCKFGYLFVCVYIMTRFPHCRGVTKFNLKKKVLFTAMFWTIQPRNLKGLIYGYIYSLFQPKNNLHQGPPPTTPLNKTKMTAGAIQGPLIKKDKRHSSSRFNITKNRELEMLPPLKGKS